MAEWQAALWQSQECTDTNALCLKCGSNWGKKDGHSRGRQQYKCNQRCRKRQEGAKHRFTDEQKEQAVKMRAEGMSLSATARVMGASVTTSKHVGQKRHWRESV